MTTEPTDRRETNVRSHKRRASDRAQELLESENEREGQPQGGGGASKVTDRRRDASGKRKRSAGDDEAPRRIAGLRASALIEIALFVGVILLIDRFMMQGNGMAHVAPHPFWLVVLLLASQYGSTEGLLAAAVCSAILVFGFSPDRAPTDDLYEHVLRISYRPLLWFLAAVIFGELRTRQIRRRDDLDRALADSMERNRVVAAAYERMEEIKRRLEVRLAGQFRTAVSMYKSAKSIEAMEPARVLTGALDNVRTVLAPAKCSVYLLTSQGLEAGIQFGWEPEDRFTRVYKPDSPLYTEVVINSRVLCVATPEDEAILAGSGLIAGPVVNPDTGEVRAMIKIEDTGFLHLNISTIELFRVLCEWVGTLYANAQRYRAQVRERTWDRETRLYAPHFYGRYRAVMEGLVSRGGVPVSEVRARIKDVVLLGREERRAAAVAFGAVASSALRDTDFAFGEPSGEEEFILVLPATPVAGARGVARRVVESFADALPADLRDVELELQVVSVEPAPVDVAHAAGTL